jgi:LAS superfamily LD-carboxypeptidase LdcB
LGSKPNQPSKGCLVINEWLELQLTQSGGFAGLSRQAKILKSEVTHHLAEHAQEVLKQLWDEHGNALASNTSNYPDGQKLHVEVTTKHGQWVQTLNADELPDDLTAMCHRIDWKPV